MKQQCNGQYNNPLIIPLLYVLYCANTYTINWRPLVLYIKLKYSLEPHLIPVSMSKFGRKMKNAPEGFEYIEPTLNALDNELRESTFDVNNHAILLPFIVLSM